MIASIEFIFNVTERFFNFIVHFAVKPRSKSACGSRRSIESSSVSCDSQQRQPTVQFVLPTTQQNDLQSKRNNNSPKIDNELMNTTSFNTGNNSHNRLNSQQQRKLFFMQTNAIQNNFNQNKPPSGKRSYTIINTELHTNEM